MEAGKLVDRSVESCVRACQAATDDRELLQQVSAAASVVSQALHDLLQHVRQFASRGEPIGRYDQATDTIMCVTESIFSSMGDAGERLGWGKLNYEAAGACYKSIHWFLLGLLRLGKAEEIPGIRVYVWMRLHQPCSVVTSAPRVTPMWAEQS